MIKAHQPTIFGKNVIAAISSIKNGNMKFGLGDATQVSENRHAFLHEAGIDIAHTSLVGVTYDTDNFAKYRVVTAADKGVGMHPGQNVKNADALVADAPGHALFLPLADCVGAILYDTEHHVLMVSHLGRHSVEINGAEKSVNYLKEHYSTNPERLQVWLSPGVGSASYPLNKFNGQSLHNIITLQLQNAGVSKDAIENGNIDTATSEHYYSHSEFLKGNKTPGRFAIVAMMIERGEPASSL